MYGRDVGSRILKVRWAEEGFEVRRLERVFCGGRRSAQRLLYLQTIVVGPRRVDGVSADVVHRTPLTGRCDGVDAVPRRLDAVDAAA